jgi:hypothetical protein
MKPCAQNISTTAGDTLAKVGQARHRPPIQLLAVVGSIYGNPEI